MRLLILGPIHYCSADVAKFDIAKINLQKSA